MTNDTPCSGFDSSPFTATWLRFALVTAIILFASPIPATAQSVDPRFPVTDGEVRALAISGNTLYVGGAFGLIGPPTGGGVPVDTANGAPQGSFPEVRGPVYAAVPDGSEGWFVGGAFDQVGGFPRANLAHIRGDRSVDPWNPGANATVYALAMTGATIYAGGNFTMI